MKNNRILIIGPVPIPGLGCTYGGATVLMKSFLDYCGCNQIEYYHIQSNKYNMFGSVIINYIYILLQFWKNISRSSFVMINTSSRGLVFLAPTIFVLCQINGISIGLRIFGGSIREQYDGLSPPVKFLFEQTNFKSDIIFVETKASVEYLKKKLGDDAKIQWFPNVRKPFARAKVKKKYNKRFVFISHVKKSKGVGEIIEVATKLPDGYIVDIFGPVVDEWLVEKIADLNNVRYCGVVEPGMVQDLLIKYDVLLLPTYYKGEGYPGIILEALSVGMPVITTNWKSIPEIITNKYDGILISIKNSEELKEAIVGFDSSTLIEYRKNALSSFEQYNENIVYENIINMLNEV